MNEQIFWELIDKSKNAAPTHFETQCVTLTELLIPYDERDIIEFEHILRAQIERANTWPIMAASFVVCSFISDDTYEDFRAWIVGQGKENFDKILRDCNEITNLTTPGKAKDLGGEFMLFVAVNAYLEKLNQDDEEAFYELIMHPEEKVVNQQWPETKNEFRKMFPKLYDTFWNEARIQQKLEEAEAKDN